MVGSPGNVGKGPNCDFAASAKLRLVRFTQQAGWPQTDPAQYVATNVINGNIFVLSAKHRLSWLGIAHACTPLDHSGGTGIRENATSHTPCDYKRIGLT